MKVTWLAQNGLYFETDNGTGIMVDPYLSDYIGEKENPALHRLIPADPAYLKKKVDVLIITHNHSDHADPFTLPEIYKNNPELLMLCSYSVWEATRGKRPAGCNCMVLARRNEFTEEGGIRFRGVFASHSDPEAIGAWFEADGIRVYLSGDTLYNPAIADDTGGKTDLAFVCVNGKGNNMNCVDAARLVKAVRPKLAIPLHWDLLPGYTADPQVFCRELEGSGISSALLEEFRPREICAGGGSLGPV